MKLAAYGVGLIGLLLTGCTVMPKIEKNHLQEPALDFFDYFHGAVEGSGFLRNWRGQITRQFTVKMVGHYLDEAQTQLRIDESFVFNDGEAQTRIWTLTKTGGNTFTGQANDAIGTAKGVQLGNGVNWRYRLAIPYKGKTIEVDFDDWLYLQGDDRLLNAVKMKKFGLTVGSLFIAFDRQN